MTFKQLAPGFSVSAQLTLDDVHEAVAQGFKSIICNRPDDEESGQSNADKIEEASNRLGMAFAHVPAISGAVKPEDAQAMARAMADLPSPILAYCRSGARSTKLFEMVGAMSSASSGGKVYDVVIVGGGSAGIATAASLLKRTRKLSIAIIEPSDVHYYQPGWTMVGAGIFDAEFTRHTEASVMPRGLD